MAITSLSTPHARAQRGRHLHQHLVPGLVAERRVERLEVVDVADQERERALLALGARDLVADLQVVVRTVVRGGERIHEHELLDASRALEHAAGELGEH